jgi:phage-related protein
VAARDAVSRMAFGIPLGSATKVPDGIARVMFTVDGRLMVLLHGFIKKTQKIPQKEIATAKTRLRRYQEAES